MQIIDIVNALLLIVNLPMVVIFLIWTFVLLIPSKEEKGLYCPSVSVLIPVYNEEENIRRCVSSVLDSDYPKDKLEVIVIDDGSTDRTGEKVEEMGVKVIKTNHIGKAKALNRGLKEASGEIVIVIDGDTSIEKDSIKKIVIPFKDKKVGVVSGVVRTRGSGIIERFQKIEYAFVSAMLKQHSNAGIPVPFVYGTISGFRRSALNSIGGFKWKTIVEDSDTFLELLFNGWKARAVDTRVYTKAEKLNGLLSQRVRWMLGGLQVVKEHFSRMFHGFTGWYVLPLFGFWPIGTGLSLTLNAYVFSYWFRFESIPKLVMYVLRWISFIGVPLGLWELPSWGFPIPATTGIGIGLLSLVVLCLGMIKSGEEFDLADVILLLFYPMYGWILMGIAGIIAIAKFIINPNETFKK